LVVDAKMGYNYVTRTYLRISQHAQTAGADVPGGIAQLTVNNRTRIILLAAEPYLVPGNKADEAAAIAVDVEFNARLVFLRALTGCRKRTAQKACGQF
jgi:hypothetical protein